MMSQTDMELGVSASMCLCVLQHTQINVHGCPATVTPHWSIVTGLTALQWVLVTTWWWKERTYGTDCASRFLYLQTCHSFCALHMYAVGSWLY